MNAARSHFITIAAGIAGLAIGWRVCGYLKPGYLKPETENAEDVKVKAVASAVLAPVPAGTPASSWLPPQVRELFQRKLTTADDCRAALAAVDGIVGVHPLVISALRDRALRRWIEIHPADALANAETEFRGKYQQNLADELFRVWLDLGVESAMDALSKASPALAAVVVPKFFEQLAEMDPKRAFGPRWRLADDDAEAVIRIVAIWARKNPYEAAEIALTLDPDFSIGLSGVSSLVAEAWAKSDPEAAWDFFKEHDAEERVIGSFLGYFTKNDPSRLLEVQQKFGESRFNSMMGSWAKSDPESGVDYASSLPVDDPLRKHLMNVAAQEFATSDPERALSNYTENDASDGLSHASILREILAALAVADFDGTFERWKGLPPGQQVAALSGIMVHSFARDREVACQQCSELLAEPATAESVIPALSIALSSGYGSGSHDFAEIVAELPELRQAIKGDVLSSWVKTAPEAAAEFISERLIESVDQEIGARTSMAELAISRPEFMSQWLQSLPEGSFQINAATALAANWSRIDPTAVSTWLETLPDGPMRAAATAAQLSAGR